ncbi:MAG: DMT family transporter [Bosea sp. (in: a-proteobacteria)]
MLIGLIAGLGAGAFWGLTFVAPTAVKPYTEIDLAILRYLAFGFVSLALMAISPRFRPGKITPRQIWLALWLGLSGYVIYYIFVAFSVSLAGPAIAPLVIGALPVLLAIYGNWQDGTVPWRLLILPLAMIIAGLAVINSATIAAAATPLLQGNVILGFVLALCALANWFVYAVLNARALRAPDAPDALGWTSLQGLGAAAGVLPLLLIAPVMGWSEVPARGFAGADGMRLVWWALLTGVLGSWVAQYFWTVASQRLPLALSAQVIVSETIFALIYGFLHDGRMPLAHEWLGAALLLLGVLIGVHLFSRAKPKPESHGRDAMARSGAAD